MVVSHFLAVAGLAAFSAESARIARKQEAPPSHQKTIGGVPVFNYDVTPTAADDTVKKTWVLFAKDGTSNQQIDSICASSAGCKLVGHPDNGGIPFLTLEGTERHLEKVVAGAPGVLKFIEPDFEVSVDPNEKDDEFGAQSGSWGLRRVGVDSAATTGKGAHVYIFDTGVRVTHNDFGGRAVATLDVTSGSPVECDGSDPDCAKDNFFHGTHCAGTAAGTTYGVATDAIVHAVKVLGDFGSGQFSWSYEALDWMATRGTKPYVASLSLGGRGVSSAFRTAVEKAVEAGITVVVAAGNSNADACEFSPAHVGAAITVGSTDSQDKRSAFSNYGTCVDIWAPGSAIRAPWHEDDESTYSSSGTSMACPHVSGGVALLLEADPSLTPAAIRASLLSNAEPNKISSLKLDDTNRLVYVGTEDTGPFCPDTFSGPSRSQDCTCPFPRRCFQNGTRWCDFSLTESFGRRSDTMCLVTCTNCECRDV